MKAFQNERAISLYEQKGYRIIDHLETFEVHNVTDPIKQMECHDYEVEYTIPYYVSTLPFYRVDMPWQSHWLCLRAGGEAILVKEKGRAIGYVLYWLIQLLKTSGFTLRKDQVYMALEM